ncbi:hypothetical protein JCM6882_009631 [Rhodosporidiobolus microsporus]
MAVAAPAAPPSIHEHHPRFGSHQDDEGERQPPRVSPVDREDDSALDGLLQPYSFGATPTLELSFDLAAESRRGGGGAWMGDSAFLQSQQEMRDQQLRQEGRSTPTYDPRPALLHRPSSLLSRRSTSSVASSFVAVPPAPPRPYALPPGLAAHSPIPPSVSSGSTLRPSLSTTASAATTPHRSSFPSSLLAVPVRGAQPRAARTNYEPPLPLDVQWLLLTTPPPPQRKKAPIASAAAAGRDEQTAARAQLEKERAVEREKKDKERKEGLVKRLWSSKLLNSGVQQLLSVGGGGGGNGGRRPQSMVVTEEEVEMATVRAAETLDLREARGLGRRSGRIDSRSAVELVPKTWKDFEALYAAGQLDIEDPPFPPLASPPGVSSTFPSRNLPSTSSSQPSPYEAAHFPPPLHLSRITPIRERLIAQLDLLGERYALLAAPPPPPSGALPAIPAPPAEPLSIYTAVSPVPSAASASSSAASTGGRRDSLLQFSSPLTGRRDSSASTAPSSAFSHGSAAAAAAAKMHPAGISSVFPSRTPLPTSGTSSTLHITARGSGAAPSASAAVVHAPAMSKSLSAASFPPPSHALFTMRNHPALVSLLIRALHAPLGSPALFNPPPKAAVITLFPSSSTTAPGAQLTILASLNIPPNVTTLPLQHALDGHVVLNGERGLVVMDTERDWRWRGNELVREAPNAEKTGGGLGIRFYAGMPIFAPSLPSLSPYEESASGRLAIGTVALLDDQPRLSKWGASERAKLRSLSSEISCEVERFVVERDARAAVLAMGRRGSAASSSAASAGPAPAAVAALSASAPASSAASSSTNTAASPLPPLSPPPNPLPPTAASRHAKKVSFDRTTAATGSRRSSLASSQAAGGTGYVDWDAQLVAAGVVAPAPASSALPPPQEEEPVAELEAAPPAAASDAPTPEPPQPLPTTSLPPLLAASSPQQIYLSALTSLATSLSLQLVYLVRLDLSLVPAAPSLEGGDKVRLELVSSWNLPKGSQASFDPSLHLRALRAPEGGLLYRSAPPPGAKGAKGKHAGREQQQQQQDQGGFASGVLLPVLELDGFPSPSSSSPSSFPDSGAGTGKKRGWVLAGYTTDRKRRWGEREMDAFEKVREGVGKVVAWEEGGGWGGGEREEE